MAFSDSSDLSEAKMATWYGPNTASVVPLWVEILALVIGFTLSPTLQQTNVDNTSIDISNKILSILSI